MSDVVFNYILLAWVVLAAAVFASLFFINAPYGRYFVNRLGPAIKGKLGWILMEAPAPMIFAVCFFISPERMTVAQVAFLIMWEIHYIDRAFIYPAKFRISSKPLPLAILVAGAVFNVMNAYLNGSYIIAYPARYSTVWLLDIRFIVGLVIFLSGFTINRNSDLILYRLRRSTPSDYSIPEGGFFRWVSCPNYLGEILIWIGWTVATWSPVAAAFALWTIANLAPASLAYVGT